MFLSERHLQFLKHVRSYSKIERYHGLLPKRETHLYENELVDELLDAGLVDEGSICTSCGNNLNGYRLSGKAEKELDNLGEEVKDQNWETLCHIDVELDKILDKVHIRALIDIYYLSKISIFRGIAPKSVLLESFSENILNVLLDVGYINKISIKGPAILYENGFVMADRASRMLKQAGYVK
ncbi:hypothetical protein [Maridesulfovibrio sp.]|uniref:hypothetical protein n=1 Tax=Maridesulfovibrio sp. TaxID=2795000 RepID=UPI0029CA1E2D|nr:hypothetical protein [Maridesulfovibrio sp.]